MGCYIYAADSSKCPLFWTAGQRAKVEHDTLPPVPLVWKLRPYVWQTIYEYSNWPMSGPGAAGDCVHVTSQHGADAVSAGTWGTGPCQTRLCTICELPITSYDSPADDDDDDDDSADD